MSAASSLVITDFGLTLIPAPARRQRAFTVHSLRQALADYDALPPAQQNPNFLQLQYDMPLEDLRRIAQRPDW